VRLSSRVRSNPSGSSGSCARVRGQPAERHHDVAAVRQLHGDAEAVRFDPDEALGFGPFSPEGMRSLLIRNAAPWNSGSMGLRLRVATREFFGTHGLSAPQSCLGVSQFVADCVVLVAFDDFAQLAR
jgi:hypothetical protein